MPLGCTSQSARYTFFHGDGERKEVCVRSKVLAEEQKFQGYEVIGHFLRGD